ncbi:MAG TPA: enoyl-CoA hydratase/isomerase family protein [Thermoanaerobaculia bacterium]|jgi:enoyl-CoA hydratase|nr:enoyl-CoA hydratase/isomerase family protein [Thermoanaerobaculia bacterium]
MRPAGRTDFVFDDGGMNLLSSSALRSISAALPAEGTLFVFRSSRPGLFAAGADMAEMARFTPFEAYAFSALGQSVFSAIESLPMVTVALIDGDCFGGALDLALSFDLRLATPRARFSHPGARLGIVTGFGGTSRWRSVLSRPAARRLFLGNEVLSAAEAFSIGLVDQVSASFEEELARLAALDPVRTRVIKELTRHAERLSREELVRMAELLGKVYSG